MMIGLVAGHSEINRGIKHTQFPDTQGPLHPV